MFLSDIKYNSIDRITKIYFSSLQKGKEKKKEIKIRKEFELTWRTDDAFIISWTTLQS